MFEIWIDKDGYYSEENNGITVEVEEIPTDLGNAKELLAYSYNPDTKLLEKDEDKLIQIKQTITEEVKIPSESERLADLEAAFLELSTMILGGE